MRRSKPGSGRDILFALILLALLAWLVSENVPTGKNPQDEEVTWKTEKNFATGELLNVEVVKCRVCGQVLSYVTYHANGKAAGGYGYHTHRCEKKWFIHAYKNFGANLEQFTRGFWFMPNKEELWRTARERENSRKKPKSRHESNAHLPSEKF